MSYLKMEQNGDFILYANDKTPLIIGNKATNEFPYYYKISILNTVCVSEYYFGLVNEFIREYFSIDTILMLGKYSPFDSMFPYDHDLIAVLTNPFWELFVPSGSIDATLSIIDDALCYGFEFKVENGQIWCREIMNNL